MTHKPLPNRYTAFFQKVDHKNFDPEPCWPWLGATKGNGYGNIRIGTKNISAHRYAHELLIGPVPEGMDACHTCDNRWCVNPDHLYAGTRKRNMEDMVSRGRGDGGNRKHLKEHQVQEIVARLNSGMSPRIISQQLDVNYGTVTAIKEGRSYGRLTK